MVFCEDDSAHSHLGGIHGSDNGRVVRNDLAEARRSVGDTECYALEVAEVITEVGCDAHPVFVGHFEPELHGAKESG